MSWMIFLKAPSQKVILELEVEQGHWMIEPNCDLRLPSLRFLQSQQCSLSIRLTLHPTWYVSYWGGTSGTMEGARLLFQWIMKTSNKSLMHRGSTCYREQSKILKFHSLASIRKAVHTFIWKTALWTAKSMEECSMVIISIAIGVLRT